MILEFQKNKTTQKRQKMLRVFFPSVCTNKSNTPQ